MSKAIRRRLLALEKSLPKEPEQRIRYVVWTVEGPVWKEGERADYDICDGVIVWDLKDPDPYRNARPYGVLDPWAEDFDDPRAEYTLVEGELRKPRSHGELEV